MLFVTIVYFALFVFFPLYILDYFLFDQGPLPIFILIGFVGFILVTLGPQLILSRLSAKRQVRGKTRKILDNITLSLNVGRVDLYQTGQREGVLLFLQGLRGRPCLLVSDSIEGLLTEDEIRALLLHAALRFRGRMAFWRTLCSLVFIFFSTPFTVVATWRKSSFVSVVVDFLYAPFLKLHSLILGGQKAQSHYDREVVKQLDNNKALISGISKFFDFNKGFDRLVNVLTISNSIVEPRFNKQIESLIQADRIKKRFSSITLEYSRK